MARITSETEGNFVSTTVYLTNKDVVKVCDAAAPVATLTNLVLSQADGGLSGPLVQTIAAAVTWRLKSKNAEFGHRGLRLTFKSLPGLVPGFGIQSAVTVATLRIKPPKG